MHESQCEHEMATLLLLQSQISKRITLSVHQYRVSECIWQNWERRKFLHSKWYSSPISSPPESNWMMGQWLLQLYCAMKHATTKPVASSSGTLVAQSGRAKTKKNEEEPFSGINARVTFQRGVVRACVAQMLEAKLRTSADSSIVRRRTLELGSSEICDRVLKQDYSTGNL